MVKAIFLFLILVGCDPAIAGSVQLSWSTPTHRENGNVLLNDEITGYSIYYSCGGIDSVINIGNINTYTIANLSGGCLFVIDCRAIDKSISRMSSTVSKNIAPDAPVNFRLRK